MINKSEKTDHFCVRDHILLPEFSAAVYVISVIIEGVFC